jgi:hypothetical protein
MTGHRDARGGRRGATVRPAWWVALAASLVVALAALPSPAWAAPATGPLSAHLGRPPKKGQAPTQVIDAQTNPDQAGQALDDGCANLQNCSWQSTSGITDDWSSPSILGDVLYNCSPDFDNSAETAVGVSDEREESTSISESVSVEIGLGFLGFEKNTAEFEAFSKQSESFSTEVSTTNAVSVPGMWKGYTTTSILSANVTGDAYVTAGIDKLIEVKDMDLNFPGYAPPGTPVTSAVAYIGNRAPMTPQEISTYCGAISGLGATKRAETTTRLTLTICSSDGRCRDRRVRGVRPPHIDTARATLRAGGRVYAVGSVRRGRIRLTVKRPLRHGRYDLVLRETPRARRGVSPMSALRTMVPISIG